MKKFSMISILLAVCMCLINIPSNAEQIKYNLDELTVDELLAMRNKIDQTLAKKGYVVYTDITHGDKGNNVVKLQETLKKYGYFDGKVSGKYDTTTEKAVKKFQKDYGLEISGTATQSFQVFLFALTEEDIIMPSPTPTATPKPTLDPTFAEYVQISYDEYARYPEKYKGNKVELKGKVLQVIGTKEKGMEIRLDVTGKSDVVYVTIGKNMTDFNILEGDRITVYGELKGMHSYISTFLASITIPLARADAVFLR